MFFDLVKSLGTLVAMLRDYVLLRQQEEPHKMEFINLIFASLIGSSVTLIASLLLEKVKLRNNFRFQVQKAILDMRIKLTGELYALMTEWLVESDAVNRAPLVLSKIRPNESQDYQMFLANEIKVQCLVLRNEHILSRRVKRVWHTYQPRIDHLRQTVSIADQALQTLSQGNQRLELVAKSAACEDEFIALVPEFFDEMANAIQGQIEDPKLEFLGHSDSIYLRKEARQESRLAVQQGSDGWQQHLKSTEHASDEGNRQD